MLMRLGSVLVVAAAAIAACSSSPAPPEPDNQLPFGHVDEPVDGARTSGALPLRGWALDEDGIAEIRAFIDGRYVRSFSTQESRDDVAKVYPEYAQAAGRSGWRGALELPASVPNGEHDLLVQAVDSRGLTRDLGSLRIIVER
jgi:hypothetical protein